MSNESKPTKYHLIYEAAFAELQNIVTAYQLDLMSKQDALERVTKTVEFNMLLLDDVYGAKIKKSFKLYKRMLE